MAGIETLEEQLLPIRQQLRNHRLYDALQSMDDIATFMEYHVFAVWDFMSLLKALQRDLTCVGLPWRPVANTRTARFINEIVMGEETDVNENGVPVSHYEMYLDAMMETGANINKMEKFLDAISHMEGLSPAMETAGLPTAVRDFLTFTFDTINSGKTHLIASAFTFGREDIIPDMFLEIINRSNTPFPKLRYYLNRHIELDGDEHGPLSLEMIKELCGDDKVKWEETTTMAVAALKARLHLWDAIYSEIAQPVNA